MISELERTAMGAAGMYAVIRTLPTFIGVGAERSGTTSLARALSLHSEIWMCPRKEVDFFSRNEDGRLPTWFNAEHEALVPRTLDDYARLFEGGANYRVRGEFSVSYLYGPVARRIAAALPDVKLVAILRHPVDQARSRAEVMLGHPPSQTELELLLGCDDSIDGQQPLREHGQYHKHLAPYYDHFPKRQIFVRTFEALTWMGGKQVLLDLQRFLGVQPIDLELPHWNRSGSTLGIPGGPKAFAKRWLPDGAVRALAGLLHRVRERKAPLPAEGLPQSFRDEMMARWYPDVVPGLERLGVDVEAWKR